MTLNREDKMRYIVMSALLAGCIGLVGCGSEPVSYETDVLTVKALSDLPNCGNKVRGLVAYVDNEATYYYCDSTNTWASLGTLIGPEGPQGPAGQDGADGAPGADGADGADGQDGAPGADGADGAPGADGADGDSCTVTDNMDGTKTISCEDGTSATVSDGQDGQDGQDAPNVAYTVRDLGCGGPFNYITSNFIEPGTDPYGSGGSGEYRSGSYTDQFQFGETVEVALCLAAPAPTQGICVVTNPTQSPSDLIPCTDLLVNTQEETCVSIPFTVANGLLEFDDFCKLQANVTHFVLDPSCASQPPNVPERQAFPVGADICQISSYTPLISYKVRVIHALPLD